jgi:ABC-type branched-subunit amino acid transport system substrate-binding protein
LNVRAVSSTHGGAGTHHWPHQAVGHRIGRFHQANLFYTGAAPNQQIIPAVSWTVGFLRKKRFFLMGWNSVYSRAANAIIRDEVEACGGEIVGEEYVLPDSTEVTRVVA